MAKFQVRMTKEVTDILTLTLTVEAQTAHEAENLAMLRQDLCGEWVFSQCGLICDPEVSEVKEIQS